MLGVPLLVLVYQAHNSGLSLGQLFEHIFKGARKADASESTPPGAHGTKIDFLTPKPIGFPCTDPPRIGSLEIVDLDKDGLPDILVADMLANRVGWIRQFTAGTYTETWISEVLPALAHVSAVDIDKDGDLDVLVACMGQFFPSNDKIGSVVILENDGRQKFTRHTIIDHIARVTDVRAADFNGDGRLDLVVGQFGYDDGETRWMENLGNWQFRSHTLQSLSGVIHTIPIDIDNDGDMDFVSLVSQEWEEIYVFENDGRGNFKSHLIWGSTNEDYGSSGIRLVDLNRDGRVDILYTNGEAFDYLPPRPRPWHSVQWLENKGNFQFVHHSIGLFPGASAAVAADLDGDGDLDVAAVSCYGWVNGIYNPPSIQSAVQMTISMNPGTVTDTIYLRVCRSSSQTSSSDCSSGTQSIAVTANPSTPTVSNISPTTANTGSFSLTVNGSNFDILKAQIVITGPNCPTTTSCLVPNNVMTTKTATQIVGPVTLNNAGTFTVQVQNGSNGTLSNGAPLTVGSPAPTVTNVSPNAYPAANTDQTMTINGTNFQHASTLTFIPPEGGTTPSTASKLTYASGNQISYLFNNDSDAGPWQVRVNNPDGQSSGYVSFSVAAPSVTPSISNLNTNPNPPVLAQQFTVTISGNGFDPNTAQILISGPACGPCTVGNNVLTTKTATQIAGPVTLNNGGNFNVTVQNGPAGAQSNSQSLTIGTTQQLTLDVTPTGTQSVSLGQTLNFTIAVSVGGLPVSGVNVPVTDGVKAGAQSSLTTDSNGKAPFQTSATSADSFSVTFGPATKQGYTNSTLITRSVVTQSCTVNTQSDNRLR